MSNSVKNKTIRVGISVGDINGIGPEVILKAVSMATNKGKKPDNFWTGNFDLRPFLFNDKTLDESKHFYYFRDQKSISTIIPLISTCLGTPKLYTGFKLVEKVPNEGNR